MPLVSCRSCGAGDLHPVVSLGEMPLANALPTDSDLANPDPLFPLEVVMCTGCSLLQLTETIAPGRLFSEYAYFSSRSAPMVAHARSLVDNVLAERPLGPSDLVVEVASNDGYLLQHYVEAGIPVLGIDPAENVVEAAIANGVPTIAEFFTTQVADSLRSEGTSATVIHANNVLAHVPDINDFVGAMARLLAADGLVVIETPYVGDLVEKLEFDTIYHEHVFYYSLASVDELFQRNGLTIVDVDHVSIHGGSLRISATHSDGAVVQESVHSMHADESTRGMGEAGFYDDFGTNVHRLIADIGSFLSERADAGRAIAGYGAAAKATVLLNALGSAAETIAFVVDETPYKQGRYIPGVRIPIAAPSRLRTEQPDDVMIFAWNFATEIAAKEFWYPEAGGTFLVPLPVPRALEPVGPSGR